MYHRQQKRKEKRERKSFSLWLNPKRKKKKKGTARKKHTARRREKSLQTLSLLVFAAVDSLITDWYELDVQTWIPCTHCIDSGIDPPFFFPFKACQQALFRPDNAYLYCTYEKPSNSSLAPATPRVKLGEVSNPTPTQRTLVRIDKLIPDVAMVHLETFKIDFSELEFGSLIDSGASAEVYKGILRRVEDSPPSSSSSSSLSDSSPDSKIVVEETVAIKKLLFSTDELQGPEEMIAAIDDFRHEVWILSGLTHPNIVRLKGFCTQPFCIVTEFIENVNLLSFLTNSKSSLDWPLRLKIAKDVAKGMAFLHSAHPPIMHRDLKTPNVVLASVDKDAKVVAKLIDFGTSTKSDSTIGRKVDCPVWLAPEVMQKFEYTPLADVYSFGVILYEICTTERFFPDVKFMSVLEDMVISGQRPNIPDSCIPEYAALIRDCWQGTPANRPPFAQIVDRIDSILLAHYPEHAHYDEGAEQLLSQPSRSLKRLSVKTSPTPTTTNTTSTTTNTTVTITTTTTPQKGEDSSDKSKADEVKAKVVGLRQKKMNQLQSVYLDSVRLESLAEMFKKDQQQQQPLEGGEAGARSPRRGTLLRLSKNMDLTAEELLQQQQPQPQQQNDRPPQPIRTVSEPQISKIPPTVTSPPPGPSKLPPLPPLNLPPGALQRRNTVAGNITPRSATIPPRVFTTPTTNNNNSPPISPVKVPTPRGSPVASPPPTTNTPPPTTTPTTPAPPVTTTPTTTPATTTAKPAFDQEQYDKEQAERKRREETRKKVEELKERMASGSVSARTPKVRPGSRAGRVTISSPNQQQDPQEKNN